MRNGHYCSREASEELMRWIVARTLILSLFFVFPLVAVRWLGSARKNPAADILKLDAEQFAHSCWHNICIGRTTMAEAEADLRADADLIANIHYKGTSLCWDINGIPGAEGCAYSSYQDLNHVIDLLHLEI